MIIQIHNKNMVYTHRQLREVFHLLFLERLQKISDPSLYVLKGGLNFRFFFKSPRYSKDMDFDVIGGAVETLRKNGYRILESASLQRSLKTFGISEVIINDPTKAKQTKTTQRFRAQLITDAGDRLPTKVEFSRRKSDEGYVTEMIDPEIARPYYRLSYTCQHYTAASAAQQKLHALAYRSAVQARDVFDLNLLYLQGSIQLPLANISDDERLLAQENLLSLDYSDYRGQVLDYLEPDDLDLYGSETTWTEMCERVYSLAAG